MTISINNCLDSNSTTERSRRAEHRKTRRLGAKRVVKSKYVGTAKHGWCGAALLRGLGGECSPNREVASE